MFSYQNKIEYFAWNTNTYILHVTYLLLLFRQRTPHNKSNNFICHSTPTNTFSKQIVLLNNSSNFNKTLSDCFWMPCECVLIFSTLLRCIFLTIFELYIGGGARGKPLARNNKSSSIDQLLHRIYYSWNLFSSCVTHFKFFPLRIDFCPVFSISFCLYCDILRINTIATSCVNKQKKHTK